MITIDSAGNVSPGLTIPTLNATTANVSTLTLSGLMTQQFSGQTRQMTPIGGALVREWTDSIAATTGNIEIGWSYNVAFNPATGVWAGRDVADICWLERWSDVGGLKEFWGAASATAGTVPTWLRAFSLDTTTGSLSLGTTTGLATATPLTLSLGGTYSNAAGANLKLKLYDLGATVFGFGVSANSIDYVVPAANAHAFYIGATNVAKVLTTGGFYSRGGFASAVSAEIAAATYTVLDADTDLYVNFAGTVTITLPAAASYPGRYINIRTYQAQLVNSASANVSVNGVVGSAILAATAGKWATLKSDGTNWEVLLNN